MDQVYENAALCTLGIKIIRFVMKSILESKLLWELMIRYVLGLVMLAYGVIKIVGIQFVLPSVVYEYQLKELDGITLTWAFLGFSSWFSILLGLFESVSALLLLFRSTKLIGAILLFPALLTVSLINNAYGFLLHMRVLTGVLLLMDVSLLWSHRKVFRRAFQEIIQSQSVNKSTEVIINFILVGLVVGFIVYNFKG